MEYILLCPSPQNPYTKAQKMRFFQKVKDVSMRP